MARPPGISTSSASRGVLRSTPPCTRAVEPPPSRLMARRAPSDAISAASSPSVRPALRPRAALAGHGQQPAARQARGRRADGARRRCPSRTGPCRPRSPRGRRRRARSRGRRAPAAARPAADRRAGRPAGGRGRRAAPCGRPRRRTSGRGPAAVEGDALAPDAVGPELPERRADGRHEEAADQGVAHPGPQAPGRERLGLLERHDAQGHPAARVLGHVDRGGGAVGQIPAEGPQLADGRREGEGGGGGGHHVSCRPVRPAAQPPGPRAVRAPTVGRRV